MSITRRAARRSGAALLLSLASLAACQSAGGLGNVLGSVLGGGQQQAAQLAGTIAGVDTRSQQIGIQAQNGQTVGILYDGNTRVIYQGRNYPVTALERGDRVVARVLDTGNGAYYTDSVYVTASVSSSGGSSGSGAVQALQGVVRQIDRSNGLFSLDLRGASVVVSMPYNARAADVQRFRSLRAGETVRLYGVFLNNTRVELRQFY